jgi:hypothetical protein
MGLLRSCLEVLEPHLRGASILSLGYPDLAVTNADLQALFGVRAPANQITGRPDTAAALRALGATMRAIDVRRSRGVEEIVDLNVPQELGQYDLVLDAGTIEHCFTRGDGADERRRRGEGWRQDLPHAAALDGEPRFLQPVPDAAL